MDITVIVALRQHPRWQEMMDFVAHRTDEATTLRIVEELKNTSSYASQFVDAMCWEAKHLHELVDWSLVADEPDLLPLLPVTENNRDPVAYEEGQTVGKLSEQTQKRLLGTHEVSVPEFLWQIETESPLPLLTPEELDCVATLREDSVLPVPALCDRIRRRRVARQEQEPETWEISSWLQAIASRGIFEETEVEADETGRPLAVARGKRRQRAYRLVLTPAHIFSLTCQSLLNRLSQGREAGEALRRYAQDLGLPTALLKQLDDWLVKTIPTEA